STRGRRVTTTGRHAARMPRHGTRAACPAIPEPPGARREAHRGARTSLLRHRLLAALGLAEARLDVLVALGPLLLDLLGLLDRPAHALAAQLPLLLQHLDPLAQRAHVLADPAVARVVDARLASGLGLALLDQLGLQGLEVGGHLLALILEL